MNMEAILDGQHEIDMENLNTITNFFDKIDGVILDPRENDREIQRKVKPKYDGDFIVGFFVLDYEKKGDLVYVLHSGHYDTQGRFLDKGPALFSSSYLKAYKMPEQRVLSPEELYSFEEL